jgi:hypoxanthine phosphoribosyltransferase
VLPNDVTLREIHSAREVRERIDALANDMLKDYSGGSPLFVVIAEGARTFAQELVRRLAARELNPDVMFLRASRTEGANLVQVQVEPVDPSRFRAREVLVVDDIADEGRTLEAVLHVVRSGEPRNLRVVVLVSKHGQRKINVPIDYVGFELKDGWVVGVGMDLDDRFRNLDYLAIVESPE